MARKLPELTGHLAVTVASAGLDYGAHTRSRAVLGELTRPA